MIATLTIQTNSLLNLLMRIMPLDENGKYEPLVKYMTKIDEWYMTEMFNGFIININDVLK